MEREDIVCASELETWVVNRRCQNNSLLGKNSSWE